MRILSVVSKMGSRCEAKKKNVKFDNDPRNINLRGAMESRHENSMRERRRCNEEAGSLARDGTFASVEDDF